MADIKHGIELAEDKLSLKDSSATVTKVENLAAEALGSADALNEAIKKYMQNPGNVIIWSYAEVKWGKWDGAKALLSQGEANPKDILEIRVFNREEELRLVNENGSFTGRHIADGTGQACCYVDSFARLWGERDMQADIPEGYVRLADHERKLEMDVPFEGRAENVKYLGLETRNYVVSDKETGLSGYGDYRYVAIEPAQGGKV